MGLVNFNKWMAMVCLALTLPYAGIASADSSLSSPGGSERLHKQGIYTAPQPIVVPAGLALAQVREAVINGISTRNWLGKDEGSNTIQATYVKTHRDRIHKLVLKIKFDTSTVDIAYLDSEGLDYVDVGGGQFGLHKNALRWISYVRTDIETQLNRLSLLSPKN